MTQEYPVCGPREPVFARMRGLGFSMSNWSDKYWTSGDGIQVQIYGAGSRARVSRMGNDPTTDCELAQLSECLDKIRAKANEPA